MSEDSDSMPLSGSPELSDAERLLLRKMIRDEERASWARKRLRIVFPIVVSLLVGLWQMLDWAHKHIKWG